MLRILTASLAISMAALFCTPVLAQTDATANEARTYVDTIGQKALEIIDSNTMGHAEKQRQLQDMFAANVDIPWMSSFALGRALQTVSDPERQRYMEAYRAYLLARYTTNFADYAGSQYTITDAKQVADGQYMIGMQIDAQNASDSEILAGYRVRKDTQGFKIIDIVIEGVSLIATQRSEFAAVIQQRGMDALIQDLEAKAAHLSSQSSK